MKDLVPPNPERGGPVCLVMQMDQSPSALEWAGRRGFQAMTSARAMVSAVRISVLWMLSMAMIDAEIIVETQRLFFLTNEEVAMPVSSSSVPNVQVNVGSKIDFAVTAFGNPDYDATVHTSTVLRQNSGNPNPPRNVGIQ